MRIEQRFRLALSCKRRDLGEALTALEAHGLSTEAALVRITQDEAVDGFNRVRAAELLQILGHRRAYAPVLETFLRSPDDADHREGEALAFVRLDREDIERLIEFLRAPHDPWKREGAARAISWQACRAGRDALIDILLDASQPSQVRGSVAEALAHQNDRKTARALIRTLPDPDPSVRFWAVFGLWQSVAYSRSRYREEAIEALRSARHDPVVAPGWWAVGREAQAALESLLPPSPEEEANRKAEKEAILADPQSSPEERRWAESYLY